MKSLFSYITKDKVVLLFYFFSLVNILSYSSAILVGSTLVEIRIALLVLVTGLILRYKGFVNSVLFKPFPIAFLFIANISFLLSEDISNSIQTQIGLIFYIVTTYLFVNYVHARYSDSKYIIFSVIALSYLHVPLLLFLNPNLISLNLYGSNSIESIGLKSRFLGWSCATLIPLLLIFVEKKVINTKYLLTIPFIIFLIIISGSRSSLYGSLIVMLFYMLLFPKSSIKKVLGLLIILISVGVFFFLDTSKVSFFERQEKIEAGVSDVSYRGHVIDEVTRVIVSDYKYTLFGFGPNNFNEVMGKTSYIFINNELSSHNTYIEIAAAYGVLALLLFLYIFLVRPFMLAMKVRDPLWLIALLPILIISTTENNFGPGQFLFLPLLLLSFSLGNKRFYQ